MGVNFARRITVNGVVAAPPFDRKAGDTGTDWNDLASAKGKEAVALAFKSAIDEAEIARLASLDPVSYDRAREAAAKALAVRASTLDKQVASRREEIAAKKTVELCRDKEPWPESVNAAVLLDDIRRTISRFIICNPETATAASLWIAFTWTIEHVHVAPLAIISAPEKRCGKTQLLDLIGRLSRRNLAASNISPAALFRVIEAQSPTLLIDEADAFLRENEELRGIINSGHTRQSAYVIRTVGDDFEVKQFSTWAAKAIAGIGKLADTIMDRAIVLTLRRKLPNEKIERLRYAESGLFETLARKLARFEQDHGRNIGRARPDIPDALNDRAQDNWEPLLAIADLAGGHWPKEARRAALAISGDAKDGHSTGEELLSDIRDIFAADAVKRLSMADLIKRLCEDDMAPWATWNRGKPMTPRQLGKRLDEFGLHAKPLRIEYTVQKGFEWGQFADAWARYLDKSLASDTPIPSVTGLQTPKNSDLGVTKGVTDENTSGYTSRPVTDVTGNQNLPDGLPPVTRPVTPKALKTSDCNRVTDETPFLAQGHESGGADIVEAEL
jgi:putative DNA primase/helicase